jgi:hypothetical protein
VEEWNIGKTEQQKNWNDGTTKNWNDGTEEQNT